MTCRCKKIMSMSSPAAVHVDNTARPQSVSRKNNQDYMIF